MRSLMILPIVHSRSDLGSLQIVVSQVKIAALGEREAEAVSRSIDEFWIHTRQALMAMQLDHSQVLLYQDGLPVVQNVALQIEKQIVNDLAKAGSANHQLVQWMMEQGAALVGTESPELLIQEYQAVRRSLANGYPGSSGHNLSSDTTDGQLTLLQQRDQFIASRIDSTLGSDQIGLLFIGMLHRVEDYLPPDIEVTYPVGKPSQPSVSKSFVRSN